MSEAGDHDFIHSLFEMHEYIESELNGCTRAEVRKQLAELDCSMESVNLVIYNVHLVSTEEDLKKYITYMLCLEKKDEEIAHMLRLVGWPGKIIERSIEACSKDIRSEIALIEKLLKEMFDSGMSEQEALAGLVAKGYNEDLIQKVIYEEYGEERSIERIKKYVNERLEDGEPVAEVKEELIMAGWAIDTVNKVISERFIKTDMKYLLDLEKTIDDLGEKGLTKDLVRKELLQGGWSEEYIDLVMHKVHIVDSKIEKVKAYIAVRTKKGDTPEKLRATLLRIGWGKKVIDEMLPDKQKPKEPQAKQ
jgi:SOS response regulatory protein OraA/RecX